MARIKKGDTVIVLSGKDRGKRGKLLRVIPERSAALVERLNLVKHFERRTRADQPGGIIEREGPIALAKLALVCPKCTRPTRVGYRLSDLSAPPASRGEAKRGGASAGGAKQRICKRCGEVVGS